MIADAILNEWWTGRDARGEESTLMRAGWRDGPFGRMYVRELDVLSAVIARALPITGVNVACAIGADGDLDVRIAVDGEAPIRWRPVSGSLDDVCERGTTLRTKKSVVSTDRAMSVDAAAATLDDAGGAISALKARRHQLREQREAGGNVSAEMGALESKLAEIRGRHDALNVARKQALSARVR